MVKLLMYFLSSSLQLHPFQLFFKGPHGKDGFLKEFVQFPAQQFRTLTDHVPGAACGKFFVLEFFL